MIDISEDLISSIAPNEQAIKNGKELVLKGKFVQYQKSSDETLLMGECTGSGKDNYLVSADFVNVSKPIFRCTCPSRQLPCKHAIGLLFGYLTGKKFTECEIPEDILSKREKIEKREEKKAEVKEDTPKKVNVNALVKKIEAQIEGLEFVNQLLIEITTNGLGTLNVKQKRIYEEQVKKLGDYYLTGVQEKFRAFLSHFSKSENDYPAAILDLVELNNLVLKGKDYLIKKKEDPLHFVDTTSGIEELIGNTWQLSQLKELGLVKQDVKLIQLAFNCIQEDAAMHYVDFGIWIDVLEGHIYKTQNFRPYKAMKYIKEDDSCFSAINIKELYIYPGNINQRVRFEESTMEEIKLEDYQRILNHAKSSIADVVKLVKNTIKNPLSDREVYVLVKFKTIGQVGDQFVIENDTQERLVLSGNCQSLSLINQVEQGAMLGAFKQNYVSGILEFTPLSIITNEQIIRLTY